MQGSAAQPIDVDAYSAKRPFSRAFPGSSSSKRYKSASRATVTLDDRLVGDVCCHCDWTWLGMPKNSTTRLQHRIRWSQPLTPHKVLWHHSKGKDPRLKAEQDDRWRKSRLLSEAEQEGARSMRYLDLRALLDKRADRVLRYCTGKEACLAWPTVGPQALLLLCFLQDFIKD